MSNAALMERGFLTQDRLIWSTWVDLAHLIRCFLEFIHFWTADQGSYPIQ